MSDNPSTPPSPSDTPETEPTVQQLPPHCLLSQSATHLDRVPYRAPDSSGHERYELLEEIARGGMGIVFRAHDRVLNREVGLKTLLDVPAEGSVSTLRFRAEAHITSQLQHPNIPPVHDLGTLPDGRPFLAMKLIEGETLDAMLQSRIHPSFDTMLRSRIDPAHESGRYLAIFENIAQAVAYAHDHRVVHRDLKPLNVMVGKFGEVQVMDWGLAKHLTNTTQPLLDPNGETSPPTKIRLSRDESNETQPGSVFGTPAYMPREQAIGAIDQIDTRTDVFSLGGILCAILTGMPPYDGGDAESTRQLAATAKLDDAFARLDNCGAEPELIALCKRCLATERDQRPRDAGEVATAVADLRAEAERRARQAELDRTKAKTQAAEQRKRRRMQLALLATAMLLLGGVGAFAWWEDKQAADRRLQDQIAESKRQTEREREAADRQATEARLEGKRAEAERIKVEQARDGVNAGLKLAGDLRKQYKFKEADAVLAQAMKQANSGAPEQIGEVEQAKRDLAFVVKLDDIRFRKWMWITEFGGTGHFNTKIASPEYRTAFADQGLDLRVLDVTEAARRIAASAVKADLVAAVDDWALYETNEALRDRLLEIARKADPGLWTNRLRDSALWTDKTAVAKLAAEANPEHTSSAALSVLATLMWRNRLDPTSLLTATRARYPTDFELAFALGNWHGQNSKDGQQIGPYEAARALRPENASVWNNLGAGLASAGDLDGGIVAFKKAIELNPTNAAVYFGMGFVLASRGDLDGAIALYKKAIDLDPKYADAYSNLGAVLARKGDWDGVIVATRKAIELDPHHANAYSNRGVALANTGDLKGAIAAYQKAIELNPKLASAHYNLGFERENEGDRDGAVAAYKKAIEVDPKFTSAYAHLGILLERKGDVEGAMAVFRKAAELNPKDATAHSNLGLALANRGDLNGAIAAYKKAIELNPKYANAYSNLGAALQSKGDWDGAITAFKTATKLNPQSGRAYINLGVAMNHKGDWAGSIAAFKKAAELIPKDATIHNNLAYLLAAGPDRVRDGYQAVEYATRACELSGWKIAHYIHTLAAAYAEAGDFDKAIEYQKQALSDAAFEKQAGPEARKRLALYGQKKAYRDPRLQQLPQAPPPHEPKRP